MHWGSQIRKSEETFFELASHNNMSLHLLHHKSWHVWNKDNIEKVRRDEQKFKEEEEKKHQKQLAIVGGSPSSLNLVGKRKEIYSFERKSEE